MKTRLKLYILSFTGFMVNYMLRTDINIALLSMVKYNTTESIPKQNISYPHLKVSQKENKDSLSFLEHELGEFDWTIGEQNNLKSGFYLMYFIASGLSSVFISIIGPTRTFGYGQFVCGLGSSLIPFFASNNYIPVLILRSLQGFSNGLTWPAYFGLLSRWVTPTDKNRFFSASYGISTTEFSKIPSTLVEFFSVLFGFGNPEYPKTSTFKAQFNILECNYLGYFLGIGFSYIAFGFVINNFGWRTVFYLTGVISTIWCMFWLCNVYDDPEDDPNIDEKELKHIQSKRVDVAPKNKKLKTPWKHILISPLFWSIAISNFGRLWIISVIFLYSPLYLQNIVHLQIHQNGIFSGIPYVISWICSLPVSSYADYLVKNKILSTLRIRIIFTIMSQVVPGLLMILIICTTTVYEFTLICTVLLICFGFSSSASSATLVDIAPNFAGPLWAGAQFLFMTANFLCPFVVNYIVYDPKNSHQWVTLFNLSTAVAVLTFIPYLIFATDKVQYWNNLESNELEKNPEIVIR